NKVSGNENFIKKIIKSFVIKNSNSIFGNGTVSRRYFNEVYGYPNDRIYNQYLTVDADAIKEMYKEKDKLRIEYRNKYGIADNEKVLLYSGRLIELKNIKIVIEALAKLNKEITMVILGDGFLKNELEEFAKKNNIKLIISGFIDNQNELFKQYYIGDCFILPSNNEVWGLVVNEAMFSGLPVLVSNICGCSLDLVKEGINGYVIDPYSVENIKDRIDKIFFEVDLKEMGNNSIDIINKWTFTNSRKELEKVIMKCS
ncbi:MAG: glycosyltransferase, partial [Clostridium sp.]